MFVCNMAVVHAYLLSLYHQENIRHFLRATYGERWKEKRDSVTPGSSCCHIVCFYVLTVMHSLTWIVCIL